MTLEAKHNAILNSLNCKEDEIEYLLDVVNIIESYSDADNSIMQEGCNNLSENMNGFVEITGKQSRGGKYNEYMMIVENKPIDLPKLIDTYSCDKCKVSLLTMAAESCMICPNCGKSDTYFESSSQSMSYDQEINSEVNISFAYKRINHFNELLAQFQAKESTNIPQNIIDDLNNEFKKARVQKKNEITQSKVRFYLKKLGYNKFYEHVPHITNILNGIKPPNMTLELEEKLRSMFRDIQEPFERNKPKDRSNFLSYNYCLYKFCELLGHDEFLTSFSLLKSREKLHAQDKIWKLICRDMNWQYIPTV